MSEVNTTITSRDPETGRLLPGHRVSVGNAGGNPSAKRMSELKKALIACGTEDDVQKLYAALLAAALDGDTPAAKLLLDHLVGRPTQPIEVTGTGPAPVQTDIRALVAIIHNEVADPEQRLRIARSILQLGQQPVEQPGGPIDGNGVTD